MVNNPLSAENFSQLYASLETLDVTQIVSTLLKIAPLRDEIRSRLRPSQPRVRRKRRTRAEMEAQVGRPVDHFNLMQPSDPVALPEERTTSDQEHAYLSKRKSRKGTPSKLLHQSRYSYLQPHHRPNTVFPAPKNSDSTGLSTGTASPGSSQSDVEINQSALANSILGSTDMRSGLNAYAMQPSLQPPIPYWDTFRMAASQLIYNYTNMMMVPSTHTGIPKTQDSLFPQHNIPSMPSASSPQHSETCLEQTSSLNTQEEAEPHITVVDDMDEVDEQAEDLSFKPQSEPVDCTSTTKSIISTETKEEITPSTSSQQLTEINCPDCGISLILSDLTSHIQNQCPKRVSPAEQTKTEALTESLGNTRWESCTICSESIPTQDMIKHFKQRHAVKDSSFRCDICDESFRNKSTLKRHKITHTSGGGHACSYCAKIFAKPELLRRHELLHTEVKRVLWPCSKCDKSFSNKYNLAVHDRMHTGELPFPCPHCSEKFRVKCSMQNHIKSRHPEVHWRAISPAADSVSSD